MKEYDYLNARIKGMHSVLLGKEFYNQVLAAQGTQPLVDALLNSPYSPQIRDAIDRDHSVAGIESGLRRNLFDTFEKVRELAPDEPRWLMSIQFRKWDVQNVLSAVRGKAAEAPADDILAGVFPAGQLSEVELEELAHEENVQTIVDTLIAWDFPFAFELAKVVRGHSERINCAQMELEFMRVFFDWAMNQLSVDDPNQSLLRNHIGRQIDLVNLKGVLWNSSQKQKGGNPQEVNLITGGLLSRHLLSQIDQSSSLETGFEILAGSYFRRAIDKGILAFGETRRLAAIERFLEIEVVDAGCKMFRTDPLGIGVPLGYIWRKYNEFVNLRILLRNKAYGKPAPATKEELFVVEGFSN